MDAVEGEFCFGLKDTLCCSPKGRRRYNFAMSRIGLSRNTDYKFVDRYDECGMEGLRDRSRRTDRCAHAPPPQLIRDAVHRLRHKEIANRYLLRSGITTFGGIFLANVVF